MDAQPSLQQSDLFSSPASSEGWVSLPLDPTVRLPGAYLLRIAAVSGSPRLQLRVTTPSAGLMLNEQERAALAAAAVGCCGAAAAQHPETSPFCTIM